MTAEEMFETLGYKMCVYSDTAFGYELNDGDAVKTIAFGLDDKNIEIETYSCNEILTTDIDLQELAAINKQVEELNNDGEW